MLKIICSSYCVWEYPCVPLLSETCCFFKLPHPPKPDQSLRKSSVIGWENSLFQNDLCNITAFSQFLAIWAFHIWNELILFLCLLSLRRNVAADYSWFWGLSGGRLSLGLMTSANPGTLQKVVLISINSLQESWKNFFSSHIIV